MFKKGMNEKMACDYMNDNFCKFGNDLQSYREAAEEIDEHTSVRHLDFRESSILHYTNIGNHSNDTGFTLLRTTTSRNNMPVITDRSGRKYLAAGEIRHLHNSWFENAGCEELLPDIEKNQLGFIFYTDNGDDSYNYYFLSRTAWKTFERHMPINVRKPDLTYTMALATMLKDMEDFDNAGCRETGKYTRPHKNGNLYCTVRTSKYDKTLNKIYAFFSKKDSRTPFAEIADAIENLEVKYGKAECVTSWEIGQGYAKVIVSFANEVKEMKEKYPEIKEIPCYEFYSCDTGEAATNVSACWMIDGDEDPFRCKSELYKMSGSFENAFEKLIHVHGLLAESRKDPDEKELHTAKCKTEFVNAVKSVVYDSTITTDVGKNVARTLTNRIIDEYYVNGMIYSRFLIRDYIAETLRDMLAECEVIKDPSSARMYLRNRVMGQMIFKSAACVDA
jgi:hypothetical protein